MYTLHLSNCEWPSSLRLSEVRLDTALELAASLDMYAYDSYVIACALKNKSPLMTLDRGLLNAAQKAGVTIKEVQL